MTRDDKIGIVAGIAIVIAGIFCYVKFSSPLSEKMLTALAAQVNKSCPTMIDDETRLDNVVLLPDNVFQYNYTLVNLEKAAVNLDEMKSMLHPVIEEFVKTSPEMQFQRKYETTVNYSYKDKDGQPLMTITIRPDQYK